ncbi:MAG: class I SAM-dependent methyltransferase [Chloroflexi bacterium]|nr:class I SAM-dependent methyltransferase [Chloroflexota bacterium]
MEQVGCNLCGSIRAKLLFPNTLEGSVKLEADTFRCTSTEYGRHPPIVKCLDCGLVYTNPRPVAQDILSSYRQVIDDTYVEADQQARLPTFRRNFRPLASLYSGAGRLLDIGCYVGAFLEVARQQGWDAWGVEPSEWAARLAQDKGFPVSVGTLRQAGFTSDCFDAVTLWDVIEHLPDPMGELREVHRILRPGGSVLVHTVNIDSKFARLMDGRWPWLMEMHLYYFSPRTLCRMLEAAGFAVSARYTQSRYVTLGYLVSRIGGYSKRLAQELGHVVRLLRLDNVLVSINMGDLMTVIGRKAG